MFRLLVDALVSPKAIAYHVDEKPKRRFVEFIFLLAVLLMIPSVLSLNSNIEFRNVEAEEIVSAFKHHSIIDYKIKDGKLIYIGSGNNTRQYVKIENNNLLLTNLPVYLVFSMEGNNYNINDKTGYLIVFKENEMEIVYAPSKNLEGATEVAGLTDLLSKMEKEKVIKTISYDNLNVNFDYTASNNNSYFLQIYSLGSHIYNKLKLKIVLDNSLALLISNLMIFTASTFLTILLIKLFFRGMGVAFGKIVKIAFLASLPYVVCYVLAYLYNLTFLAYIGELVSLFYTIRALSSYALLQKLDKDGGINNEL